MARDRAQKRDQLAALEAAVLNGATDEAAVSAHVAANGLDKERGAADLAQLRRRWARKACCERERADVNLGLALARAEYLFAQSLEAGQLATALAAEVHRAELLGLYPTGRATTPTTQPATKQGPE